MTDLVVFNFDGTHTADDVLNKLRSLQIEHLIGPEDACVVEREQNGKVHIKQGAGALSGSLTDCGVNDDFARRPGQTIPPGSARLVLRKPFAPGGTSPPARRS